MDYKQLRRILRERLDAPGTKTNENYMHGPEEPPAAVQELPVHDLPVNIAPLVGDELVEPPVNDAEFVPGNLQQLQHAASVLMQHVPPLQVQDFYHQLRRLITTSIRQQNRAGENANDMMPAPSPDQEIQRADQAESEEQVDVDVAVAENIRRIVRNQLDEHKVRQAVRSVMTEQMMASAQLDLLRDPDFVEGIENEEFFKILKGNKRADVVAAIEAAEAEAEPGSRAAQKANDFLIYLKARKAPKATKVLRAATGKTGTEAELLNRIADELGMGVSGVRNIIGRFSENVGLRYFLNRDGSVIEGLEDQYRKASDDAVNAFEHLYFIALHAIYLDMLKRGAEPPVNVKELRDDIEYLDDMVREGGPLKDRLRATVSNLIQAEYGLAAGKEGATLPRVLLKRREEMLAQAKERGDDISSNKEFMRDADVISDSLRQVRKEMGDRRRSIQDDARRVAEFGKKAMGRLGRHTSRALGSVASAAEVVDLPDA